MSKDSLSIDLLRALIFREHQVINTCLNELLQSSQPLIQLRWLKDNAILKHQYNEELLIHKKLLNKERLKEGGPFCVLFFDEHIVNPPAEIAKKYAKKDLTYCRHQLDIKAKKSPLDIPLEEHASLNTMLDAFLLKSNEELTGQVGLVVLQDLFKKHHEKEEKCFFVICQTLLVPHEIEEILEHWVPLPELV